MANYNDDFSSYPIASGVPTGFVARWVTANVTHSIVDSAGDDDNKSFRQNRSATGRGLVTMDAVDGDSNRANSEILVRVKLNNPSGGTASAGPALRCSGTAGNESGYVCYPIGNKLRITWYKGGVSNTDHRESATLTLTDGAFYWIRFRVENTTTPVALKARMWSGLLTDENTSSWQVDTTETNVGGTSITAAGWSGMFAFGATTWDTDAIAVGTNGDTATFGAAGINGTGANTIGEFTQAATGEVTGAGSVTGTGSNTVGAFTQVATGEVTGSGPVTGTGANTVGTFTQVATGTVASASLSIGPVKNNTGTLLTALTVPKLAILRLSDMSLILNLTSQTTNGSGFITVTNAALVGGTGYVSVLADGTGDNLGTFYGVAA